MRKKLTIGDICPEIFYKYKFKLVFDKVSQQYQVKDKEEFVWAQSPTTKGAVITACRQGIRLRDIHLKGGYVPIKEVIKALKE